MDSSNPDDLSTVCPKEYRHKAVSGICRYRFLLKEDFPPFWADVSPHWAGRSLDPWFVPRTLRSRIEPMKEVAWMLRAHRFFLLNGFRQERPDAPRKDARPVVQQGLSARGSGVT